SDSEYNLISKAKIPTGFHLYSQDVQDGGPIPTSFIYDDSEGNFKIIGNTTEEEGQMVNDPVFEMEIKYFEDTAIFKQKVKINESVSVIHGFVEFMICDDTRCSPPIEEDLEFKINGNSVANVASEKVVPEVAKPKGAEPKKGLWSIFIIAFLSGF